MFIKLWDHSESRLYKTNCIPAVKTLSHWFLFRLVCAKPDVGVLSWNQFLQGTLKWKALFQPPCTKLDCVLESRGLVFLWSFSLQKGQSSRVKTVPRRPLSPYIYGYSTAGRCSKSLACTADKGIQYSCLSVKWRSWIGQSSNEFSETRHLWQKIIVELNKEKSWILWDHQIYKILKYDPGKIIGMLLCRCWLNAYFCPLCWESGGINQCQRSANVKHVMFSDSMSDDCIIEL